MRLLFCLSLAALALASCSSKSCNRDTGGALPAALDAGDALAETTLSDASDIVTHASGLWDAGPPVVTSGVVDGASLRARNRERLSHAAPVTILRGKTALELGERICNEVVPHRSKETPVLLKPNLGGFDWFKDPAKNGGDDGLKGRITDPEFVRGVIHCLKARGHTKITVAEGWGATHKDWEHLVRASGYEKMASEEGVPLVAMDDDGVFDVELDQPGKPLKVSGMEATNVPNLLIPKILAEHLAHGMFLSLPKIKAHRFGVVSMSVKGMQGTVMLSDASPAFRQKWRMHRELNPYLDSRKGAKEGEPDDRAAYVAALEIFAERMSDVLEIEAPDAVLAEGAPAMGGDGFQKLYPSAEMVAIGGTHPILVDRVGAQFLGLWNEAALAKELGGHASSPLIETAGKRFAIDLEKPVVTGDGADLLHAARPVHFVGMAPFAIHRGGGTTTEVDLTKRPRLHAPQGDAVIDGNGNDPAWAKAQPVTWDTDYAGNPTGVVTKVRALWSKAGLTTLIELEESDLNVDTARPIAVERSKLYDEDCAELFFTPDPSTPTHYYEVELGPLGHFFDIDVDRKAKREDVAWSAGLQIATTHDAAKRTATIEARLTAPEVLRALAKGRELPLGLFRMDGKSPRRYLAWSPPRTPKPNFHVPEAFGTLLLEP